MTDERAAKPSLTIDDLPTSTQEYVTPGEGWVRDQLAMIDEAGTTDAAQVMERPIMLVIMRGARSGQLRRVPLMRVEHDGAYAAIASAGGAPKHPVWKHNLDVNPDVVVQDGTEFFERTAELVTGQEREIWWERAVAAFPPYADYQVKTDREIPVYVLKSEPSEG